MIFSEYEIGVILSEEEEGAKNMNIQICKTVNI